VTIPSGVGSANSGLKRKSIPRLVGSCHYTEPYDLNVITALRIVTVIEQAGIQPLSAVNPGSRDTAWPAAPA
jgi:hypothetical protein